MSKLQEIVYDGDEYAYKKVGESDAQYEKRLARMADSVNSRVTEEEKRLATEILSSTTNTLL